MLNTIQTTETGTGLDALAIIGRADLAENTRRVYSAAVAGYFAAGGDLLDAEALAEYADGLSDGTKAHLRAAVVLLANEIVQRLNATAQPLADNVVEMEARTAQAERRLNALQNAITVKTSKGQKTHTWLSQAQVKTLLDSCSDDLKGERDRLALGLLVCAGLRRSEAVDLTFEDIKQQSRGEQVRTVLAIEGKGKRRRTVPISDALAQALDQWGQRVGGVGRVLRSVTQAGELRDSMSDVALFKVVQGCGEAIGKPNLAPHDLRRTYAQLGYEAGVPITQLSTLLGHSSVATTQRYLNLELDLSVTASDFIPF